MARFYSFDGIDGAGKSTQLQLFCDFLRQRGEEVIVCRDPGSTELGEKIRAIVLHADDSVSIGPRSEMLLYMAARAQLVDEVIRPALATGKTVVSDRFLLANVVYQGYGGGLDVSQLWQVGQVATDGLAPDLTFLLDMPEELAAARLGDKLDRMESRGAEFRQRLRAGFLAEAEKNDKIVVVAADRAIEEIQGEIRRAVDD
ncbi:MAG: dTMP kinase [Planctomycetales bacterium]|nr:dTMP kinase [Planctomycetales bacterium]